MRAIAVKEFRELHRDRRTLSAAGLPAAVVGRDLRVVPATFEETFVRLALARQDVTPTARERTSQ